MNYKQIAEPHYIPDDDRLGTDDTPITFNALRRALSEMDIEII